MKCEHYEELISPYLDDALSNKEKLELEAHLDVCPVCKETLQKLRYMTSCLSHLEDAQLPESFHFQLHKRLTEEVAKEKVKKKNIKLPYKIYYVSGLVAAVFIAFIVGPYLKKQWVEDEEHIRLVKVRGVEMAPMSLAIENETIGNESDTALAKNNQQDQSVPTKTNLEQEIDDVAEKWLIKSKDLQETKQWIERYCKEEEIKLTVWETEDEIHLVFEPTSKEVLKQKLSEQVALQENIQIINSTETPIIHLVINNES